MNRSILFLTVSLVLAGFVQPLPAFDTPGPVSLTELAGDYYHGDGLGVNCTLSIQTNGSFAFKWTGCLGTYDANGGQCEVWNGRLTLKPRQPNQQKGFSGTPTEFFAIRWGPRLYLVPTNDIVEFCCGVNDGSEPRQDAHGSFYLRHKDWERAVKGKPAVPAAWAGFLLNKPVKGEIIVLEGLTKAWINVGAKAGLQPGMILTAAPTDGGMFTRALVKEVAADRCLIANQWPDHPFKVGQTVVSDFFRRAADSAEPH